MLYLGKIQTQDAYAICRVFKKSTVIVPKVGGQCVNVTSHANQITSDQSSSIELYSEGRGEDFDNSNYLRTMDTCSTQYNMGNETNLNINDRTKDHGKWSNFSSEDDYPSFSLPTSSFTNNYGAIPYPPSKVHKNFHAQILLEYRAIS